MKKIFGLIVLFLLVDINAGNLCCSYPCQNNGVCLTKGFKDYECDCTRTDFYGKNCDTPNLLKRLKLWLKPKPSTIHNLMIDYQWYWDIVNSLPFLRNFLMKTFVLIRSNLIDIPPPYDNDHSYITLGAHFNHSFYTRVLPPVPEECPTPMGVAGKKELPDVNALVKKLFVRKKFKPDPIGTSVLFSFMAQHFSHMFLKTDFKRGPQYQWGGHGIDVTNIYGKNKHDENLLRSFKDGKLKLQTINSEDWPVLTKDASVEMHYLGPVPAEREFALGHSFYGNFPGLFMLSTIWMREHNRVCDVMKKVHPEWDDERIFQTGKLILLGQTIKIVIEEYVQHLSNYNFKLMFKPDLLFGENFQYQARASVEFNHLYYWHPLMPDEFIIGETNYTMRDILVNPGLVIKHGMATFVDSLSKQSAGAFTVNNHGAITLPVVQKLIQNGRTLRLQSYNNYRKRFNLQPYKSFEDLTGNKKLAKVLEDLYGDIDTVEFYVGLIAEKRRPRGMFSEGLLEIGAPMSIKGVMSNPICSPKYWKPSTFGGDVGFEIVNTATLKKLFCQNMKGDCPEVSFKVPGFVEQKRTDDDCAEHEEL
ncbi:prostaglandin-endoperoxide synthase 2 [Mytilus galloprovincialis]|uniref:prostaglandin-endoperoxide synthase n=1 Tax=Mytilus galloprovincialis TaxID=29158 RepID=A0A8B6H9Q0_MYTGA|nr:prostaglandin-endoperoxide synthase 2 [Mytilus galloprovincialis]